MNMKKFSFLSIPMLMVVMVSLVASCGGDEAYDSGGGTIGSDLVNKALGTWMCVQSTDIQQGQTYENLMVGKEVTIKKDGTYTSTAPTFGFSGTYTISGDKITAKSNSGGTFVITVTISGEKMTWNGTASNGVTFTYVFEKENTADSQSDIIPFTEDMIIGKTWKVKDFSIERGANNTIQKGKTIRINADGTCKVFHSMETEWQISGGILSTYYKQTGEPMYVYMLLAKTGDEMTVQMQGTLDDNLQASLTLAVEDVEPTSQTTADTFWSNKEAVYSSRNACYSCCSTFEEAQLALEKVRTNPNTVHAITPTSLEVKKTWESAYKTIMMANTIMDNVTQFQGLFTNEELNELLAEVSFIRAFVYYNIAMLWGNVPMPITASVDAGSVNLQSKQDIVYNFVYNELTRIMENVKQQDDKLHVNRDAVRMLLAELEMTRGNLSVAQNAINQIDINRYVTTRSLIVGTPDLSDIWVLASSELGSYYPIYTLDKLLLYQREASSNLTGLEEDWKNNFSTEYGYWASLKRLGKAQAVTNCYTHELLMPIPNEEIIYNPQMIQNPGY